MANEPLTAEGLVAGVLKLRLERDAAIDLLREARERLETFDGWAEKYLPADTGGINWIGLQEARVRAREVVEKITPLLAAIDGAPAPAESEA